MTRRGRAAAAAVLAVTLGLLGACGDTGTRSTAGEKTAKPTTSAPTTEVTPSGPTKPTTPTTSTKPTKSTKPTTPPETTSPTQDTTTRPPRPEPVTVVAAGDIACPPGRPATATTCQQQATADLAASLSPDDVLVVGDLQYERGTAEEFSSYDDSWGRFASITKAVPGNHEYYTDQGGPFFDFFGITPPGYSAFDAGGWRIYLLNTNCTAVDCDAEAQWLSADLADHPTRCTALAMHYPRYSSGEHGDNLQSQRFWKAGYAAGADLALAGHDHTYERFAPMTPDGTVDESRGITSFVVGSGGKDHYSFSDIDPGSQFRDNTHFGVLELTLRPRSFDWAFHGVDAGVLDSGRRRCSN